MKIPGVLAPEFMKFGDMLDDDDDEDEFITAFTSALSWIRGLGIRCQSKL